MKEVNKAGNSHLLLALVGSLFPISLFIIFNHFVVDKTFAYYLLAPGLWVASIVSKLFPFLPEIMIGIQFWLLPILGALGGWFFGKALNWFFSPLKVKAIAKWAVLCSLLFLSSTIIYYSATSNKISHNFKSAGYEINVHKVKKINNKNQIQVVIYPFRTGTGTQTSLKYNADIKILKEHKVVTPEKKELKSFGINFPYVEPPFIIKIVTLTVYNPTPTIITLNKEIEIKKLYEDVFSR